MFNNSKIKTDKMKYISWNYKVINNIKYQIMSSLILKVTDS